MGEDVAASQFSREDRQRYRDKVKRNLDVFERMLRESRFDSEKRSIGLEIELNLTDEAGDPAMANAQVLERIADDAFVTELGQFNVEINIPPRLLAGEVFSDLEQQIRDSLNAADDKSNEIGAHMMIVGILPTLGDEHLHIRSLSANSRYQLLNEQIFAARGEDLHLAIDGVERLSAYADSIAPEAACTSFQLHQLVHPEDFARHWNAAQAIAGVQLAVGANSPFFFGTELWRETRIALFEENVRYFPALLPLCDDEDPLAVLERGDTPALGELRLHNGTVYRWNRPVYEVVRGRPHVRVENRVLPAGPTVVDVLANAAFYYGLVRSLVESERPIWSQMSFSAAEDNLHAGARDGLDARLYWPGVGDVPVTELVLRRLLPLAHEGLEAYEVDPHARDRLLEIIERRCVEEANGATWQSKTFRRYYEDEGLDRVEALRRMTVRYRDHMHANEPVHTWPVG